MPSPDTTRVVRTPVRTIATERMNEAFSVVAPRAFHPKPSASFREAFFPSRYMYNRRASVAVYRWRQLSEENTVSIRLVPFAVAVPVPRRRIAVDRILEAGRLC